MHARRLTRWLLFLVALVFVAPAEARRRAVDLRFPPSPPPVDVFSAGNPAEVYTRHLALDLDIDFARTEIRGAATHTIVNRTGANRFVVDTRRMTVRNVTIDGAPAQWSAGNESRNGQAVTINIRPETRQVRIEYVTWQSSSALYWLTAAQTIGGTSPFLFTFTQPDHAREWIPLQDTPGVRMTYEATIRVPRGLLAIMSARNPTQVNPTGVYRFEMPYPIPSYLIALAVGRLEFRAIDSRTGVYAEPELLEDGAWDLQYLPAMLDAAERLMGPYPFDRYDVLLCPPGFLAGGMENPMLNFLAARGASPGNQETPPTPVDVMAHELAHSWAGDATTCATWSDTWLNEGFATYYAKRILEEMMGPERSEIGWYWNRQAYESFRQQVKDRPHLTTLHRQFSSTDNPSVFSPTTYDKGSIFLKTLEDVAGRRAFDEMMRSWFEKFAWRWVDDRAFLSHVSQWVDAEEAQLEEWLYGSGFPSNATAPQRSALWDRIGAEAARLRAGVPVSELDAAQWNHFDISLFLWQATDVLASRIAEVDARFGLSRWKTPSIHWFLAMASTRYAPGMAMFERYLMEGAPNVVAIYQRLTETAEGRAYARAMFERAKDHYDSNTRSNVERILSGARASLAPAA